MPPRESRRANRHKSLFFIKPFADEESRGSSSRARPRAQSITQETTLGRHFVHTACRRPLRPSGRDLSHYQRIGTIALNDCLPLRRPPGQGTAMRVCLNCRHPEQLNKLCNKRCRSFVASCARGFYAQCVSGVYKALLIDDDLSF